jgi:Ca2+-binding RTX toxin-like protein
MAISSNGTVLARLAGGLYNQTLSNSDFTGITAAIKTAADINTFANEAFARDFAGKTDAQVATTLLANLGLSSVAGLNNWVAAQLTAAGSAGKGAKIVSMLNDFAGMTADATYGAAAAAFNAKATSALALSQTSGSAGGDFNASATLAAAAAAAAQAAADAAAKAAADKATTDKAAADKAAADAAAAKEASDKAAADKAAADKIAADQAAADALLPKVITLTTNAEETVNGTASNETYKGLISATATKTTFNATDIVTDSSTTDNDTLELAIVNDVATTDTPSVRNVENLKVTLDASTTSGSTGTEKSTLAFVASDFTGVKTYSFDNVREINGVTGLTVTGVEAKSTLTASTQFPTVSVGTVAAGDDVTVVLNAPGSLGTPATLTASTAAGDVTATAAGYATVTASTATGVVNATAAKGLTVDAAAALVVIGKANDGNLTISNADAAVIVRATATGDISITDPGTGSVAATAGGTITLANGTSVIAATTATLSATGTSTITAADSLASLNLSGNGAAATYTLSGSHDALAEVTVTGSSAVTLKVIGIDIETTADKLTVTDTGSGVFTLEVGTTAGNVDLRNGGLIDRLELKVDNNAKTMSVKSGQTVTITADQTATTLAVGSDASKATNAVTVTLDDESKVSGAVDVGTSLTITQAKTVTINADGDTTTAGTANASSITGLTASQGNSNVTINAGVNGITLAGTSSVGTGTLTINSSGTVALSTIALTAASLDASAATGAVTTSALGSSALALNTVNTVKSGSGNDSLVFAGTTASSVTVSTAAGNDTVTLPATDFSASANIVSIDLGEGTDTLIFQSGTKISKGTGGSVSLAGVENITLAAGSSDTQEIGASLLNGATYSLKGAAVAASGSALVAKVASTDTTLNFSTLTFSDATDSSLAAMALTINASPATASTVITGGAKIVNNITGSGTAGSSFADTLTGGTLNDTFNYATDADLFTSGNVMVDSIVGGAGNADILSIGGSTAFTIVALDSFANMSGVERINTAGSGATGAISLTLGATAETAGITTISLSSGGASANTVSVAAYTTTGVSITGDADAASTLTGGAGADSITGGSAVDNITGGAGNDRITSGGAADTLSGGLGDDTFVFSTVANFNSTGIVPASIAGGDGTDIISITSTAGWTLANTEAWTVVTSVETLTTAANTAAISISLDSTAWAAGLRTVDISADTATAGITNTIDADEITSGAMILKGGADEDSIKGGSGADTITGGDGVDSLVGGSGNDVFVFASSADLNDNDVITFVAADDKLDFSAFLGSSYSVLGASGIDTSITVISGTSDVNIASKIVLIEEANGTTDYDTVAEIFAAIDGSGDMMSLTSGKAVIIRQVDGSAANTADAIIFFIDTTLDGAAGLSVADIVIVGTLDNIVGATTVTFNTGNFV